MVNTCASSWKGDEGTKLRCEAAADPADPLSSEMPVTHKGTATTYRNLNCAICNLDSAALERMSTPEGRDEWVMWGARLECSTVLTGSRDLASVRHALRFENGSWGLRLPRNISGPMPKPPQHIDETDIADKLQAFIQANNETRSRLLRGRNLEDTTEIPTMTPPMSTSSGLRHLSRRNYAMYNASQFHRNDSALVSLLKQRQQQRARARRDVDEEDEGDEVFHKCDVDPLLPDTLTHLVRRCRPKVIGECPMAWVDHKVC